MSVPRQPQRLHHHAWVTADQEATRRFYEEVVGLRLVATWTERSTFGHDGEQAFCHTFFALADGSALAFFQFADAAFAARHTTAPTSPFRHVALRVDRSSQDAIRRRATARDIDTVAIDHGYCESLYLTDPNGLRLEFTVDHPHLARSDADRQRRARGDLQRWLAGDHDVNNDGRP